MDSSGLCASLEKFHRPKVTWRRIRRVSKLTPMPFAHTLRDVGGCGMGRSLSRETLRRARQRPIFYLQVLYMARSVRIPLTWLSACKSDFQRAQQRIVRQTQEALLRLHVRPSSETGENS